MYRRGVASDTQPFSRPLPLCGDDQRAVRATRLNAPPRSHPRGAAGTERCEPVGRGIPDAPPGVGVFALLVLP